MIAIEGSGTLDGSAAVASKLTYTITGEEISSGGTGTYKTLAQGQLGTVAGTLYTAPSGGAALVSHILVANTDSTARQTSFFIDGTTAAYQISNISIPANGQLTFDRDGWKAYDSNGALQTSGGGSSGVSSFNTRTGAVTSQASDIESTFTATGQLFVGTGAGTGELLSSAGTVGYVLTIGGSDPSGIEWASAGAAGVSSYNARTGAVTSTAADINSTFTATGQLFVGTAAGTGELLAAGTSAYVLTSNGTTIAPSWQASAGGGGVLATHVYAPATRDLITLSGTLAALDTTNLTLAFTVPASGIVDVVVSGMWHINGANSEGINVALLNHTGSAQIGLTQSPIYGDSSEKAVTTSLIYHLTGLSPGALQVDVAASVYNGGGLVLITGTTGNLSSANVGSPMTIQAIASV